MNTKNVQGKLDNLLKVLGTLNVVKSLNVFGKGMNRSIYFRMYIIFFKQMLNCLLYNFAINIVTLCFSIFIYYLGNAYIYIYIYIAGVDLKISTFT